MSMHQICPAVYVYPYYIVPLAVNVVVFQSLRHEHCSFIDNVIQDVCLL